MVAWIFIHWKNCDKLSRTQSSRSVANTISYEPWKVKLVLTELLEFDVMAITKELNALENWAWFLVHQPGMNFVGRWWI